MRINSKYGDILSRHRLALRQLIPGASFHRAMRLPEEGRHAKCLERWRICIHRLSYPSLFSVLGLVIFPWRMLFCLELQVSKSLNQFALSLLMSPFGAHSWPRAASRIVKLQRPVLGYRMQSLPMGTWPRCAFTR